MVLIGLLRILAIYNLVYRLPLSLCAQHCTLHQCDKWGKHSNTFLVRLVRNGVLGQRNRLCKYG